MWQLRVGAKHISFNFFIFKKLYPLAKCYQTTILGLRFYAENMTLQILVVFEKSHFLENKKKMKKLRFFFHMFSHILSSSAGAEMTGLDVISIP